MIWFMSGHLFSTLLEWMSIGRLPEQEKNLEIQVLRQQMVMLERRLDKPIRPTRIEKLTMAVVTATLKATSKRSTAQLREMLRLFQPETVLKSSFRRDACIWRAARPI